MTAASTVAPVVFCKAYAGDLYSFKSRFEIGLTAEDVRSKASSNFFCRNPNDFAEDGSMEIGIQCVCVCANVFTGIVSVYLNVHRSIVSDDLYM